MAAAPELGVNVERAFLVACLAGGETGRVELRGVDPDRLFTSALLRRVVRRLAGQLEISPGVVAVDPVGESPQSPSAPRISEEQVDAALEDLRARAERASATGRTVGAEQLEHARLLLELAHVERQLVVARLRGEGVADLARERQTVKQSLGQVVARLERPL